MFSYLEISPDNFTEDFTILNYTSWKNVLVQYSLISNLLPSVVKSIFIQNNPEPHFVKIGFVH